MTKLPDTFCVMPWINLSTEKDGSTRPCCKYAMVDRYVDYNLPSLRDKPLKDIWNDGEWQRLRQAFIDGKQPLECQTCWKEEAAGLLSMRQMFTLDRGWEKELAERYDFTSTVSPQPFALDLKLSNVCNLKCRICGPMSSSQFMKEAKSFYPIEHQYLIDNADYYLSNKITQNEENRAEFIKWAPYIRHVEIFGGEPMVSEENFQILEMLEQYGDPAQTSLLYNTNTTIINKKAAKLWEKFKHVRLSLSIDDTGRRFEYQRYPSKWEEVKQNIDFYHSLYEKVNLTVTLFCSVNNYNVFYLPEYHRFMFNEYVSKFKNTTMYYNLVHHDPWWCITNLPEKVKPTIARRLNGIISSHHTQQYPPFSKIADFMNSAKSEPEMWAQFINRTKRFDQIRKNSFTKTFPEFVSLLDSFEESSF